MAEYTDTDVQEMRAYQLLQEAYDHLTTATELSNTVDQSKDTDEIVTSLVHLTEVMQESIGIPHETIMEMFGT